MRKLSDIYITSTLYTRFHSFIQKTDYCWFWLGAFARHNYGSFSIKNKTYLAHRLAYYIYTGTDPEDLFVCHSCDNTSCVNPEHLFLGTHLDNEHDKQEKGHVPKGINHGRCKLTEEQVKNIRFQSTLKISHLRLAKQFHVSKALIYYIVNNKNWKHI